MEPNKLWEASNIVSARVAQLAIEGPRLKDVSQFRFECIIRELVDYAPLLKLLSFVPLFVPPLGQKR